MVIGICERERDKEKNIKTLYNGNEEKAKMVAEI
jgi:hypothetical protein